MATSDDFEERVQADAAKWEAMQAERAAIFPEGTAFLAPNNVSVLRPFAPVDDAYLELAGAARDDTPPTPRDEDDTYPIYLSSELEELPPPDWLVHEVISDEGLAIIYGDSDAGKSFIALDMAIRIALGADWHGIRIKRTGVLYVGGEGAKGMGKRITGWRLKHHMEIISGPIAYLPVAVQMLEPGAAARLIRSIDKAKRRINFDIGLTIVDTVSRAIAGVDENTQQAMTAFIKACDDVRAYTGGALIGVHHQGKDKERGMRGSSVLHAACDTALLVEREDKTVTITCEKQKDAERMEPMVLRLEKQEWIGGTPEHPDQALSTLVPVKQVVPEGETELGLARAWVAQAFGMMVDAWVAGNPLSNKPQTRRDGRFAPAIFASKIGGKAIDWEHHIEAWLTNGVVEIDTVDRKNKRTGLRVIDAVF